MADEAKAPVPAAPPPTPAAAPPAKGKGPILLIAAGCGGILLLTVLVVVVWVAMSFLGGGLRAPASSPDLKTPESAAKSYMMFEADKEIIQLEARADRSGKEIEKRRALLPWMADTSEEEKDIKRTEAWLAAYRKNRSELLKVDVSVIDVKDADSMKLVRVKVTGKKLDADGEDWKLADRNQERTITLTQIEGKWKVSR